MTHGELGLIAALIAVLGIGGGKLWGNTKIDKFNAECDATHTECKGERVKKETEIKEEIEKQIKPRLVLGNLIMLELAEKAGVPKDKIRQLEAAVGVKITE